MLFVLPVPTTAEIMTVPREKRGFMKNRIRRCTILFLLVTLSTALFAAQSFRAADTDDEKKILKVGMECSYAPYNWSQTNDSNGAVRISNGTEYANGYDVKIAKKIAEATGYKLEIVKTEWGGLATGVATGKLDAAIAGMSATADRKKTVDFTDDYYKATIYALVKNGGRFENAKSIADLKGASCTSQQSTVWYTLLYQIPDAVIQPAIADMPTMIVALQTGKTDVLLCDKPTALAATYANKDLIKIDLENDKDLKVPKEQMDIAIAVNKKKPELREAINKALAGISESERTQIMNSAAAQQPLNQLQPAEGTAQEGNNSFAYWVMKLLNQYGDLFLHGALVTIELALVGTLIGCAIGLLVGVLRTIPKPRPKNNWGIKALYGLLQFLLAAYIEIFRGTPMMVQAMVLYFGSMSVFHLDMSPMAAGFFVVSINTGAYMAETVRGGIQSVETGQTEAAEALGMTHWQTMGSVILPQTIRNILPQIGNNLIINIKDTSVLNVISVTELYFEANSAAGASYKFFEAFFIISVIYFLMTFICSRLLRWIERKIDGSGYYTLVDLDAMSDPTGTNPVRPKGGMHKWGK